MFDIFVKARLLRCLGARRVRLDPTVGATGRKCDAVARIEDRDVFFEATVLTASDKEREEFYEDVEVELQGGTSSIRCIIFDSYVGRLVKKVKEKVAPKSDPARGQLSEQSPNVLLIWLPDRISAMGDMHDIWLDEAIEAIIEAGKDPPGGPPKWRRGWREPKCEQLS